LPRRLILAGISPVLVCITVLLSPASARAGQTTAETRNPAKQESKATEQKPQGEPAEEKQEQEIEKEQVHERAERELKQQEHQRVLGIIPAFNSSNTQGAAPLTPSQKFRLALKSASDPFAFAAAAVDAGINQLQDDYHGYGEGMSGYSKRFGASYADTFDATILGNALFPVLFHQDPRYFRKGTGSVKSRVWYALLSTVRCKGDSGNWQPSYSNLTGNLVAGTVSNLYYPRGDRGIGLTVQRAFTVSAEGAIGALFFEFWPDISRKLSRAHKAGN
jgi:hypothetical protein